MRVDLETLLPGTVSTRLSHRLARAHDASHFLLTPEAVLIARDASDVQTLLAARPGPLTFRSGGTSLNGQAGTDGLLVDTRTHFRGITVLDDGARVRVQPGATVRAVNTALARHGRKLGPDPASEGAATLGGVIANNASGMAAGITANTYRTMRSAVLLLADGTRIDTAAPDADERLAAAAPAVHAGLLALRDRVRANPDSVATIRRLFALKNTMGYSVNAFLDHERAVDILLRLVVGSEGTLAWVAEATFETVPTLGQVVTGLLVFPTLDAATAALPDLVAAGFATVELMDATSLRVAQRDPNAVAVLRDLDVRGHAALLVEFQEPDAAALTARVEASRALLAGLDLSAAVELTPDAATRAALWHIRKGLYATVAGARRSGTTALLEDVAVPVPALRATCEGLAGLFARHGYEDSVIFGHAKDGNLHFMLTADLDDPAALATFEAFTLDLVDLILGLGGTLKAEHGTGRMMAPFVERQYGSELYAVMCELKDLLDPYAVLNPGVLLSADPDGHVRHLKSAPTVEAEVDRCVECGYCEPVCPSKDLTLTPRQRIVLRRELASARAAGDEARAAEIEADYAYDGVQTCAVDGMCGGACPVEINTGDLVRRLRAEAAGAVAGAGWRAAAAAWAPFTRAGGAALSVAKALPPALPRGITDAARAVLGTDQVPRWTPDLPGGGRARRPLPAEHADVVFVPSCLTTLFGAEEGDGAATAFLRLARRAGLAVRIPDGIEGLCCGTPWSSKGMTSGKEAMRERLRAAVLEATRDGAPVVMEAASCTEGLDIALAGLDVTRQDAVTFTRERILPRLTVSRPVGTVVVHPTCSTTALGATADLVALADAVGTAVVPDAWGCCAFAGDRGMLHPELTASATAREAAEVAALGAEAHVSANRTCEIGMSRATGATYRHVLELLEEATRPEGER